LLYKSYQLFLFFESLASAVIPALYSKNSALRKRNLLSQKKKRILGPATGQEKSESGVSLVFSSIPMWSDDTLHTHKVTTTQLCLSAIFLNYFIHFTTTLSFIFFSLYTQLKKIRGTHTQNRVTHDAIIVFLVLHNTSMFLLLRHCFFWWPFCLLWLDCIIHHSISTWS